MWSLRCGGSGVFSVSVVYMLSFKCDSWVKRLLNSFMHASYFGPDELWLETDGGLSDFRFNLLLPEIEEFKQSLLYSDPYVQRHRAIGPL